MKENLTNVTIVAIVAIVLLGVLAVSTFAMTGMAVSKIKCATPAINPCEVGEVWSDNACKCIPAAKGKSDQVHDCQIFCQIGAGKTIILVEEFDMALDTLFIRGLEVRDDTLGHCQCPEGIKCLEFCPDMLKDQCIGALGCEWIPGTDVEKVVCMKACLGVPLGGGQTSDCPIVGDGFCDSSKGEHYCSGYSGGTYSIDCNRLMCQISQICEKEPNGVCEPQCGETCGIDADCS